ncbi:MAG TPA: GNAT family N-acetyltransferase [Saprospiraceae bacterium]|nr:GNAT family N-acetyltransferase [Saprospiraceae bacterium]
MEQINATYKDYLFSSDKNLMQWSFIHSWISKESYWAMNIPIETVMIAGENSYCIGVFDNGSQIGYTRIITDYATFAYLADVFIIKEHRAKGLSKYIMELIMNLDWIKGLRRLMLTTLDAQELYNQFGFHPPLYPERIMEIRRDNIYGN